MYVPDGEAVSGFPEDVNSLSKCVTLHQPWKGLTVARAQEVPTI